MVQVMLSVVHHWMTRSRERYEFKILDLTWDMEQPDRVRLIHL